jgi:ClpP class serine protease
MEEQTMGIGDIFWFFFMISALQPIMTRRLLEFSRQRLISKIEHDRGSRVILLVHREEKMNFLGFPVYRYIDVDDSEEVLRAIHMTGKDVPIDLILHTPGGLVLAALQIAEAIKKHKGKVTAFVPHYAMSGGTLISLAAREIVMSEHAVLGPVDPQLGKYPAASVLKVIAKKPIKDVEDETLIMADQAEKAIFQVRESVKELLQGKPTNGKVDELARLLSEGTWTHDFPITYERAQALGLPVNANIPDDVLKLMALYPQPTRTQPTVEYLPGPRTRREAASPSVNG